MQFRFSHRIPAPVEAVEDALMDPATLAALPTRVRWIASVEPVERTVERARIRRVTRFVPDARALALPPFVDPTWAAWSEHVDWNRDADRGTFRVVPDLPARFADRVVCGGTYRLDAEGDGCRRTIDGALEIRVPLLGDRAERMFVDRLRETFEGEAALLAARSAP